MEELVEILINLLASFFQNRQAGPGQRRVQPLPRQVVPPQQPPIGIKKPAVRRGGRRPASPMIAVAAPILTGVSKPQTTALVPMARLVGSAAAAGAATAHNAAPSQSAQLIRKWMTPATLKNQFLLTEILQPPLALREERKI